MRILQVIDTLMYGGAQKLLVTFAQQAQERGVETTIISLYNTGGAPVRADLEACGTQTVVLNSRHLFEAHIVREVLRLTRAGKFDAVHTHLTYANITGALAARLNGLPVVATLHNTAVDARHSDPVRDQLEFLALRFLAQRVLGVGASVATAYEPILHRSIDVIPNAVQLPTPLTPEERRILRTGLAGDPQRPICITVGRFSPQKGYSDLLDAFARVRLQRPETVLVIIGDGTLRPEIEVKIAALGLGNHVKLLGLRNDVLRLLPAADLYVNASHWEGLPIAHLEAMMAGLPVAATGVGETPQVVVDGTGLLVPPQKPEELAGVILTLLSDPARAAAMGRAAQEHALRHYGAPAWFDKILDLYRAAGAKI